MIYQMHWDMTLSDVTSYLFSVRHRFVDFRLNLLISAILTIQWDDTVCCVDLWLCTEHYLESSARSSASSVKILVASLTRFTLTFSHLCLRLRHCCSRKATAQVRCRRGFFLHSSHTDLPFLPLRSILISAACCTLIRERLEVEFILASQAATFGICSVQAAQPTY